MNDEFKTAKELLKEKSEESMATAAAAYWQGYADGYEKVLRDQNLKIRKEVKK